MPPLSSPAGHCASRRDTIFSLTLAGETRPVRHRAGRVQTQHSRATRVRAPRRTVTAMDLTIETHRVSKRYGRTVAVDELSIGVHPGLVTAFVGPNGAGKTTTMPLLLGLADPDSGEALVRGRPYATIPRPLTVVGALLDARAFHPSRSARSHLRWLAQSNGIPVGRADAVL